MANFVKPLVLNNGSYLQTTEYNAASHLDEAHVKMSNAGKEYMTDLGIIQPFVTAGFIQKPYIWDMSSIRKNRVYVEGNIFKWKTPIADEPCYIVEDISGIDRPGAAGEKFKIKVNKRQFGHGHIIGVDPQSADQLLVTGDEIYNEGDSTIYTVRYLGVNQGSRHFPKEYLKGGTKLFILSSTETEYSDKYPDIPLMNGGMREYFNTVGTHRAALHYSITRNAAYKTIRKEITSSMEKYKEILEMYVFKPGSLGHQLSLYGQKPNTISQHYTSKYGKRKGEMMIKKDVAWKTWVPLIEAIGMKSLELYVEGEAMFGSGGKIRFDGKTEVQRTLGLFHQLNMGNQHNYNLYNFTLEKFEFIIASRLLHRVEKYSGNEITIKTGMGGLAWIQNMLRRQPQKHGMVVQAANFMTGGDTQQMHWAGLNFVSWDMGNGLGKVKFELATGLDPIDANEMINPLVPVTKGIGGHRLSSYMFIIDDITNAGDNVVELVDKYDWDLVHRVIQGKMAYPFKGLNGGGGSHLSASNHPGFEVYMEKRHKAYWVKDVTKSLLIKPINPFTGRPIYDGFYK